MNKRERKLKKVQSFELKKKKNNNNSEHAFEFCGFLSLN